MKGADRILLIGLGVAVIAAFAWFMLLAPKRKEAARLDQEASTLQQSIAEKEQAASYGEQARRTFPRSYQQMVVLGKAAPAGDDTASLLVQLNGVAAQAGVEFRGITLSETAGATAPPEPAPTTPTLESDASGGTTVTAETTPAPATEAVAANLPIGAAVGPAGLPVMPYKLTFTGDFFRVGGFIGGVDELIGLRGDHVIVDGRLLTIDGFSLTADDAEGFPTLDASFAMTAYATPSDQGLTLGATPAGPSISVPTEAAPASATTPTSSTTPTAP